MNKRLILLFLSLCVFSSNAQSDPALNKDGSVVTGVLTASFDPSNAVIPFPSSLLYTGTTDLTLNIPVADPGNVTDPIVALNSLDGFDKLGWFVNRPFEVIPPKHWIGVQEFTEVQTYRR